MSLKTLQAELDKVERRREVLQKKLSTEAKNVYTSLPAKVGLRSVDALITALLPYASTNTRDKLSGGRATASASKGQTAAKAVVKQSAPTRKDGATVHSDQKKAAVKAALVEGKLTGREIAKKNGMSYNTLKKWKKAWNLTEGAKAKK